MNKITEWINSNIDYRVSTKYISSPNDFQNLTLEKTINRIALHNSIKFFDLNGFNNRIFLDESKFLFKHIDTNKEHRYVNFSNYTKSIGAITPFLVNWCDAQGWDYNHIFKDKCMVPIFQFSRRKSQRDQVNLFPLESRFMGYGGANIPKLNDSKVFNKKNNMIVWRGRISGTQSDWINKIYWSESLVLNATKVNDDTFGALMSSERMRLLPKIFDKKYFDAGFIYNNTEINNINQSEIKKSHLLRMRKNKLSMLNQFNSKFILAIPGNDYASSLYWSLLSNSVVFLLDNEWETALDCSLEPWVHYVPVKNCYDDIMKKFEYMLDNTDLCLNIINNAHEYMQPYCDHELRDKLDYLTIKRYEANYFDKKTIGKAMSFSRSNKS